MNIVITGCTGFIGKNLINFLIKKKPNLKIYAFYNKTLPAYKNSNIKLIKFNSEKNFQYDFIDKNTSVIHLAWDYIPNYDTLKHKTTHLKIQKKFIKKILNKKPRSLFVMGTCFEYGFPQKKVDEQSEIKPLNHYAQAKNLLRIYIKKIKPKFTNFTWGRLFYVYGKNQAKQTLYGQYTKYKDNKNRLRKLVKNKNLELDYLSINTVCRYITILALNKNNNNEVNICSGKKILLQNMINRWSKKKFIKVKKRNLEFFYGSNTKLRSIINESKK
jgi:nucleoside-diphosphate-sugar epimerase